VYAVECQIRSKKGGKEVKKALRKFSSGNTGENEN
jgi:hypothetical protein